MHTHIYVYIDTCVYVYICISLYLYLSIYTHSMLVFLPVRLGPFQTSLRRIEIWEFRPATRQAGSARRAAPRSGGLVIRIFGRWPFEPEDWAGAPSRTTSDGGGRRGARGGERQEAGRRKEQLTWLEVGETFFFFLTFLIIVV